MPDLIDQLYYLIDERLPVQRYPDQAKRPLETTLSPEQRELFEDYQMEVFRRDSSEGRILFRYLVKLGLHIP